jgi:hypothetical protein
MDRDPTMRRALNASVFFNLGGALLFAFPDSIGRLVGLPTPVPVVYSLTIAFLVTLFAATYGWLARQPNIDRPLVAMLAIGKAGFFLVVLGCWLFGAASTLSLVAASGDLVFAAIFAWWLAGEPVTVGTTGRAARRDPGPAVG